ncbi:hypothetical protein [Cellulomonas sp. KH9]|uniref:hypothetical protein n=1 Tax=Cellulomonas sp. KH9 TaxID=1855324 RepID=UPI0011601EEA|nr:hypothetical protein [Cellulomonas sp. KH9]
MSFEVGPVRRPSRTVGAHGHLRDAPGRCPQRAKTIPGTPALAGGQGQEAVESGTGRGVEVGPFDDAAVHLLDDVTALVGTDEERHVVEAEVQHVTALLGDTARLDDE